MIDTKVLRAAIEVGEFDEEVYDLLSMCATEIESLQSRLADPSGRVTLLDDFAMSAQSGLLAASPQAQKADTVLASFYETLARRAYAMAHAMLAERSRLAAIPAPEPPLVLQAVEIPPVAPAPQEPAVAPAPQEPEGST